MCFARLLKTFSPIINVNEIVPWGSVRFFSIFTCVAITYISSTFRLHMSCGVS